MGLDAFRSGDVEGVNKQEDLGEVGRLFPTLELIEDNDIVEGVKDYVDSEVPGYFWKAPAASTDKYHHELATNERGLWTHTLMCATNLEEHKWTYLEMGWISYHELDCARAAVLLHDTLKYGDKYWDGKSAAHDHDVRAAEAARRINELPEEVAQCIETHMGPANKYAGPDPRNHLELLVHQCDMGASSSNITPKVYNPPEELTEVNPHMDTTKDIRDS